MAFRIRTKSNSAGVFEFCNRIFGNRFQLHFKQFGYFGHFVGGEFSRLPAFQHANRGLSAPHRRRNGTLGHAFTPPGICQPFTVRFRNVCHKNLRTQETRPPRSS